jgi:hypothetical protein
MFVDERGRPFLRPLRSEFPGGVEGDVAFVRARQAWLDSITSSANRAFDEAFRKALR